MNMTRFFNMLFCLLAMGFMVTGIAFAKGKADAANAASGTESTASAADNSSALGGGPSTPLQETSLGKGDPEAATVQLAPAIKKETIYLGQVKAEILKMERVSGQTLTPEQKRQVLDVMINEKLALQAAARDRVSVTDAEINQQFQELKDQVRQMMGRAPTDNELAQIIVTQTGIEAPAHLQSIDEKRNYIFENFRDQVRRQGTVQRYLSVKKESLFKSIKMPTSEEISQFYNEHKSEFSRPDMVRFTMIQVEYGPDGLSKSKAKELADRLSREIGGDASRFDETVMRSQAPNSGYRTGGSYLANDDEARRVAGDDFVKTAFSLKQGQVSKVIEGLRAYQIIKITETYPARKNLALDDIVQPGSSATVRDFIGNAMLQEQQQKVLAQATEELINELRAGKTFQVFEKNLNW
jgi:parvulin-like peptidyl-prolyl isomerase